MKQIGVFDLDKIYNEDCILGMKDIPDNSIDIIIADPPYNLSKGGNWKWNGTSDLQGFGGAWNKVMENWDNMPFVDYFAFTITWLKECKRILKSTGSMWVHGSYHNIGVINTCMQLLDIEIINEVVWFKRNSFPNLSGRRLTASHETILWAHSGSSKNRQYFFNYDESKNNCYEYDLIKKTGKQMRTVWDIPNNKEKTELLYGKHPTQKPIRLLKRMLDISANKNMIGLSPFSGSGSECLAFKEAGLHYIGFEIDTEFFNISNERLRSNVKNHQILLGV
jgi:site-specific DNA-methyltransferase (adenine-specific)